MTIKVKKTRKSKKKLNRELLSDIIKIAKVHPGKIRFELDGEKIVVEADNRTIAVPISKPSPTGAIRINPPSKTEVMKEVKEQREKDYQVLEEHFKTEEMAFDSPVEFIDGLVEGRIELDG
jgi:hypothetical protein